MVQNSFTCWVRLQEITSGGDSRNTAKADDENRRAEQVENQQPVSQRLNSLAQRFSDLAALGAQRHLLPRKSSIALVISGVATRRPPTSSCPRVRSAVSQPCRVAPRGGELFLVFLLRLDLHVVHDLERRSDVPLPRMEMRSCDPERKSSVLAQNRGCR